MPSAVQCKEKAISILKQLLKSKIDVFKQIESL